MPHLSRGTLPGLSEKLASNDVGAATAETQTQTQVQSNDDALFYGNVLQTDFSQSLGPECMKHGFVPGDEFNADESLSFSMASTSFFPNVGSGMLADGYGLHAPCTTVDADEALSMNGVPASNFLDVPAPNHVPLTMFDSSNWLACMDTTPLRSYSPQQELLGEKPASRRETCE
jgi:hypothetical protein